MSTIAHSVHPDPLTQGEVTPNMYHSHSYDLFEPVYQGKGGALLIPYVIGSKAKTCA